MMFNWAEWEIVFEGVKSAASSAHWWRLGSGPAPTDATHPPLNLHPCEYTWATGGRGTLDGSR